MATPWKAARLAAVERFGYEDVVLAAIRVTTVEARESIVGSGPLGWLLNRRDAKWAQKRLAERPALRLELLPMRDSGLGRGTGLAVLAQDRLLIWHSPNTKAKELLYDQPLGDIAEVHDRDMDQRFLDSTPRTRIITIVHKDNTALWMWAREPGRWRKDVEVFLSTMRGSIR